MTRALFLIFLLTYLQGFAQQTDRVDFLRVDASVIPNAEKGSVIGEVAYTFKILRSTDSIYLDAKNMRIENRVVDQIDISSTDDKIWLVSNFKENQTYRVKFGYHAIPTQALYFFGNEIWTQGQGKYTSHWLPSLDDTADKMVFNLSIGTSAEQTVIANGKLLKKEKRDNTVFWQYKMLHPMSSYLVAFAIGSFDNITMTSRSGVAIDLYYEPADLKKVEPTYRYSKQIFDFLEAEIGVAFPWQNYKQVPVRDFLYAGMENTTATFFSKAFMVDSIGFNDRNYVNVNAHELAHQWFGNFITAKTDAHHWLQEGFATYYALLAERELFGEDYFYWQLYQSAEQLKERSDSGKGESVLNPKASSLTFYQKGAWALHILRETVGEANFRKAVASYLNKHQYGMVSTSDFLDEVRLVSPIDLSPFIENWLQQSVFQSEQAYKSLMKSRLIQDFFEVAALRPRPLTEKRNRLLSALKHADDFIGQEVVSQLTGEPDNFTLPVYRMALATDNLYIRQAVAINLRKVPEDLRVAYESLLQDPSYVTREAALYNLWVSFPERAAIYLEKTKDIQGFQNRNIRQLWLALAVVTPDYQKAHKPDYIERLRDLTSPQYSFEIRELALGYVMDLGFWDVYSLKNLVLACAHPNWRFAKYSRQLLEEIVGNPVYSKDLKAISTQVPKKAGAYLNTLLEK